MYFASYLAVVQQVGDVSSGGYLLIFWMFQNPPDLLFSLIKGMVMATAIVLVGCYYGYTASGGPVGVGTATAQSMVVNIVLVHIIGMLGTVVFWGSTPAPRSAADPPTSGFRPVAPASSRCRRGRGGGRGGGRCCRARWTRRGGCCGSTVITKAKQPRRPATLIHCLS